MYGYLPVPSDFELLVRACGSFLSIFLDLVASVGTIHSKFLRAKVKCKPILALHSSSQLWLFYPLTSPEVFVLLSQYSAVSKNLSFVCSVKLGDFGRG